MGIESPVMLDDLGNQIPDIYEMPNGCICCAMKDDFVSTLERVVAVRSGAEGNRRSIDRIVIEASGVADLEELVDIFWLDPGLESAIQLDSIVAIASASHAAEFLGIVPTKDNGRDKEYSTSIKEPSAVASNDRPDLERLILRQIVYGDVIILNKTDELDAVCEGDPASATQLRNLIEDRVKELNPTATFMDCKYCNVDLNSIFNVNAYVSSSTTSNAHHLEKKHLLQMSQLDNHHHTTSEPPCLDSGLRLCKTSAQEQVLHHHHHYRATSHLLSSGLCSVFVKLVHSSASIPLSAAKFRLWVAKSLWNTGIQSNSIATDHSVNSNRTTAAVPPSTSTDTMPTIIDCSRKFLRMKGLVWAVDDCDVDYQRCAGTESSTGGYTSGANCSWFVLQAVGSNFEFSKITDQSIIHSIECSASTWAAPSNPKEIHRASKLLFVGFGLDRDNLQREVDSACCGVD
eukprot:Lankesteria_metandrocarpae@DN2888_c0_g1_i1.p1